MKWQKHPDVAFPTKLHCRICWRKVRFSSSARKGLSQQIMSRSINKTVPSYKQDRNHRWCRGCLSSTLSLLEYVDWIRGLWSQPLHIDIRKSSLRKWGRAFAQGAFREDVKSKRIVNWQSGKSQLIHSKRQNSASGTQKAIRGKKKSQFFLIACLFV